MPDHIPGEFHIGHLLIGRLGVGGHFPLVLGVGLGIGPLDQQAAADATIGPVVAGLLDVADLHQSDIGLPLGFGREDF